MQNFTAFYSSGGTAWAGCRLQTHLRPQRVLMAWDQVHRKRPVAKWLNRQLQSRAEVPLGHQNLPQNIFGSWHWDTSRSQQISPFWLVCLCKWLPRNWGAFGTRQRHTLDFSINSARLIGVSGQALLALDPWRNRQLGHFAFFGETSAARGTL